jgi:hypothetical protein
LTKKTKLDVEEKNKKNKTLHRTPHSRQPAAKAHTQKPNGGGYAQTQPFSATKKKPRSSIKRKDVI